MLARVEPKTTEEYDKNTQTASAISLDDVFDVLRNSRRRAVLREVADHDGSMAFGDLVDEVAARENGTEPGEVDSGTRKAVYTSLYQSHLPKLGDMGVLEQERQSGPVDAGPHLAEVIKCLEAVEKNRSGSADGEESETGWNSIRAAVGL